MTEKSFIGATLALLVGALAWLPVATEAQDCHDEVCIDFSDVAGYYLVTVTDAVDGSPLEVEMTDIPSDIPPGGGGTPPPTEPYGHSGPDSSRTSREGYGVSEGEGGQPPPADSYEYAFHGSSGTWIVVITLTYGIDGDLVDVNTNITFIPNEDEMN